MCKRIAILACVSTLALSGCATTQGPYSQPHSPQPISNLPYSQSVIHARVESVNLVQPSASNEKAIGGAVVGAVVGGLLGNQVGKGSGKTLATIGGAAAGGYVGHTIAKGSDSPASSYLELGLQMDDGRRFSISESPDLYVRVGDRLKLRRQPDGSYRVIR